MPLFQTPPDAAARVYARSLFELAYAKGGETTIEETVSELNDLLELARGNERLGEFFASPSVSVADRAKTLEKIFKGRISDLTYRFLQILNLNERVGYLPAIAEAFNHESQEKFGRLDVDVYTAQAATPDALATMKQRLASVFGKEIVLHAFTEPNMLGGVKFRIGDRLVDGSISTRLRKMKDQLDTQGGANLRSRISTIIDNGTR